MNLLLTIHTNGDVTCLHTDAIPLQEIGHLVINRASTIEFNGATQLWEVRFSNSDDVVFRHAKRSACVAWEIETIQDKMQAEQGLSPIR